MSSFKKYQLVSKVKGATFDIPFYFPGVGDTGESITIVSQYAKEFRDAEAKASRQVSQMVIANKGEPIAEDVMQDIQLRVLASLVVAWTFEEEVNVDNVVEFLRENPKMEDAINKCAADDSLFFKKEEKS